MIHIMDMEVKVEFKKLTKYKYYINIHHFFKFNYC